MKKKCSFISIILMGVFLLTACTGGADNSSVAPSLDDKSTISESEGQTSDEESSQEPFVPVLTDLVKDSTVYYGYGMSVEKDTRFDALKNGKPVTLTTNLGDSNGIFELVYSDWYQNSHSVEVENNYASVYFDFGFLCKLESAKISVDKSGEQFEHIKIFASDDGYNFTHYLGEYNESELDFGDDCNYKALRLDFKVACQKTFVLNSVSIMGYMQCEKTNIAENATYKWFGAVVSGYTEGSDTALLDGETGKYVGKKTTGILIDLKEEKNVSELYFDLFVPSGKSLDLATKYVLDYSSDSKAYTNFGESYLLSAVPCETGTYYRFLFTRNHTVKANFLKLTTDSNYAFLCDEIFIYGTKNPVSEPDYGYPEYIAKSETNIAGNGTLKLNDVKNDVFSDKLYIQTNPALTGKNIITFENSDLFVLDSICLVSNKELQLGVLTGDGNTLAFSAALNKVTENMYYYNIYLSSPSSVKTLSLTFDADANTSLYEVLVYENQAQLPMIDGGFFQLPTNGGHNPAAKSTAYSWYLQLKGMRDLGMRYVVIQYSTNYNAKTTLINGKNIKGAGYKYTNSYGVADVPLAVLNAAEKLGMKVYLGTIHDADFNTDNPDYATFDKMISDSKLIIRDIYEMYGAHPAFGGYYLSDETCDYWLEYSAGVEGCRYIYKGQSDYIHEIDPEHLIMIAPAIWRAGNTVKAGENLYNLVKSDVEGGRPVVDILAAQDCLGRETTLYVTDNAYKQYISYLQEWALGARKAGVDFWHDAEVFEITSGNKRDYDTLKSLFCEAPVSGNTIVFDIPHYFATYRMGRYDDSYIYHKELEVRSYIEYFSTIASRLK